MDAEARFVSLEFFLRSIYICERSSKSQLEQNLTWRQINEDQSLPETPQRIPASSRALPITRILNCLPTISFLCLLSRSDDFPILEIPKFTFYSIFLIRQSVDTGALFIFSLSLHILLVCMYLYAALITVRTPVFFFAPPTGERGGGLETKGVGD